MIINHNLNAMNAHRMMNSNTSAAGKSMEKLSSGLRINRAGDDAAGLAISEKMRGQIRGLDQASRNSQDGISMIQTTEGALNETHSILQRMKELATQAANGTNTTEDTSSVQQEINQLTSEINRIGNTTEFNKQKVLDGGEDQRKQLGIIKVATNAATSAATPASATEKQTNGTSGDIKITDQTKYTGKTDATWKVTSDGTDYSLDKGDGKTAQKLTLTGNKVIVDGIELDMSGITSVKNTDKWEISVTAAKAGSTTSTGSTTAAVAATANGTAIAGNNFTIDAGTSNGANGNITIEVKQSAKAGDTSTAAFSSDGKTLTLILDQGKTFTSSDIQKLITSANADTNKPSNLDMTKFTVKADDPAKDSIDASKLTSPAKVSLNGGVDLPTFTSKAQVTNGTDDVEIEVGLDVSDHDHATHAISVLDKAIAMVSAERGKLGAMQNRLEHTINNLNTSSENLSAAESRIRDVDMANEMMTYSKNNILTQASQAMIAQAKSQPEQVLQLLR